ncbi:DUF4321 domain-containing protein [bacterium]|nr:DUF4321 domain-containing protein [bacterium]
MKQKKSVGTVLLILILGALIGSTFGEVIGLLLPDGVVKDFFLKSIAPGFSPATLDLIVFSITLGFTIKLNIISILGIALAAYILRWY